MGYPNTAGHTNIKTNPCQEQGSTTSEQRAYDEAMQRFRAEQEARRRGKETDEDEDSGADTPDDDEANSTQKPQPVRNRTPGGSAPEAPSYHIPSFDELRVEYEKETKEPSQPPTKVKYKLQARRLVSEEQYKISTDFHVGRDINVAGLAADEFRVLAYIKSRAGGWNRTYACSTREMKEICRMGQESIGEAVKGLTSRHFLKSRKQSCKTTEYTPLGPEHWCH